MSLFTNIFSSTPEKKGKQLIDALISRERYKAERLIKIGADINVKDDNGRPALILALKKAFTDIGQLLIETGAEINVKTEFGESPLHLVAGMGDTGLLKLLIDKGADVNAKNDIGMTPLHFASINGNQIIGELLIKNGADVNAKNANGSPPLYLAIENGQTTFSKFLIEKGAIPPKGIERLALVKQVHVFYDGAGSEQLTNEIIGSLHPEYQNMTEIEYYSHNVNEWPSNIFAYAVTVLLSKGYVDKTLSSQDVTQKLKQQSGSAHDQRFFILTYNI